MSAPSPKVSAVDAAVDALLQATWRPPKKEAVREYLPGDVIADRYRLIRQMGSGAMGVVWRARALRLGVEVAVKLLRLKGSQAIRSQRMAREAHVTALLSHPAVVRVFDFGWTAHGEPFLVTELVEGESLGELLRRREKLDPEVAVKLLLPVLDALRSAHEKGIVHRDVKPENILIGCDAQGRRQPKLLDFGLAKLRSAQAKIEPLTGAGRTVGSVEYMAPEQACGLDVDERADVWAGCVVLYECLAGLPPWHGASRPSVVQALVKEPPQSLYEDGTVDVGLWLILERGLRKNPKDRWASMTDLGEALALWLYERGGQEDICGSSLRAVWLNGSISGLKVELPSLAPKANPERDTRAIRLAPRKRMRPQQAVLSGVFRRSRLSRVLRRSALAMILIAVVVGLGFGFLIRHAFTKLHVVRDAIVSHAPALVGPHE